MEFEVGQKVRIKDDAKKIQDYMWSSDGKMDDLPGTVGEIAEFCLDGDYRVTTHSPTYGKDIWFFKPWALEPYTEPKQKAEVVYAGGLKVIFNPPYTIVVRNTIFGGKYEGRAKCHPTDKFDKWTGFVTAFGRMDRRGEK